MIMLSIIIVNYKSSSDLDVCLSSIIIHEKEYLSYEFIVVDNNSDDEGLSLLKDKYPFVQFINAPRNGGFAYGNNIGISHAHGDIVFLLNPDTWMKDSAISKLLQRITSDDNIDIIGPQLFFPDGSNQSYYHPKTHLTLWRLFCEQFYLHRVFWFSKVFNSYFRTYMDYSAETNVEQLSGAAFMFKKSVIERIGLLDESYFMYFEESDFCLNAIKNSMKLLYYPEAKIIHKGGLSSVSKSSFSTVCFYNSFKYYFIKNYNYIISFFAVMILFIGTLIRVLYFRALRNDKYIYYKNLIKNFV